MRVFGNISDEALAELQRVLIGQSGLEVQRLPQPRSSIPHPTSTCLELALKSHLERAAFQHHVRLEHDRTREGFEYDFWRPNGGIAIEVMGYRADDEVYKDILKFHVHAGTRVGVVLVPRYKWISSRRTDYNYVATLKALAFADHYMNVDALVAIAYDWEPGPSAVTWRLTFPDV